MSIKIVKYDIVTEVYETSNFPRCDVAVAVDVYFAALTHLLAKHRHVMMAKHAFHLSAAIKNPRVGRNPKTGEAHPIDERCQVSFKMGASASCKHSERLVSSKLIDAMVELFNEDTVFKDGRIEPHQRHLTVVYMRKLLECVNEVMSLVWLSVTQGFNEMHIRGFANFFPKVIPASIKRNPKTGETVKTTEKVIGRVRPSKSLIAFLNARLIEAQHESSFDEYTLISATSRSIEHLVKSATKCQS